MNLIPLGERNSFDPGLGLGAPPLPEAPYGSDILGVRRPRTVP
jgi:hypothetical protein